MVLKALWDLSGRAALVISLPFVRRRGRVGESPPGTGCAGCRTLSSPPPRERCALIPTSRARGLRPGGAAESHQLVSGGLDGRSSQLRSLNSTPFNNPFNKESLKPLRFPLQLSKLHLFESQPNIYHKSIKNGGKFDATYEYLCC